MRRLAFPLAVGLVLVAGVPAAIASQGDRYRGNGYDNGTRAHLTGTGTNYSAGLLFASLGVQNDTPVGSPDAGMQIGELKMTSSFSNDCGTGQIGIAVEYFVSGNPSPTCNMYFGGFGHDYLFAVAVVSGGWEAFENSTVIDGPHPLGFSAGYSVARGEAYWVTPPAFDFTWGPTGETAWQYKTNSSGCCTSYTDVEGDAKAANDGGWNIGLPPSPFEIKR